MAKFEIALAYLLKDEGGYWNDPIGGPTNLGITLSQYQKHYPNATAADIQNITQESAAAFYQQFYWSAGPIPTFVTLLDQDLANKLFSSYVNIGGDAIRCVQRALIDLFKFSLVADGVLGSMTLQLINQVRAPQLLQELRAQLACHYAEWYSGDVIKRGPDLLGLMRRALEQ